MLCQQVAPAGNQQIEMECYIQQVQSENSSVAVLVQVSTHRVGQGRLSTCGGGLLFLLRAPIPAHAALHTLLPFPAYDCVLSATTQCGDLRACIAVSRRFKTVQVTLQQLPAV